MKLRAMALAAAVTLASCASVGAQRERDARDVSQLVDERTGVAALGEEQGSESLAAAVRELLAHPLTDESAVKLALLNNREVRAELEDLGVASIELVQAGLVANPVFTLEAYAFRSGTEIELGIAQPFFDLFFLSARKRVAAAELEAVKARIAGRIVGVAYEVRRALVRERAAVRALEVEREVLRAAQASFDLMSELHRAGNVTDPRLTAEAGALARAKLAVADAEAARIELREPVNVLLGLTSGDTAWSDDTGLPEATFEMPDDVEQRALEASFALAEVRAHAASHARRAGLESWPALAAEGEIGVVAKRNEDDPTWGLGPSISATLPLWNTGEAQRASSRGKVRRELARGAALEIEIRAAARRLNERLRALSERARVSRDEELPLAKRLVRETLRNYNAMQIGAFDVLIVVQQESDAARRYVETLRECALANIDLEELLAGSLNRARVDAGPMAGAGSSASQSQGGH